MLDALPGSGVCRGLYINYFTSQLLHSTAEVETPESGSKSSSEQAVEAAKEKGKQEVWAGGNSSFPSLPQGRCSPVVPLEQKSKTKPALGKEKLKI